MKSAISKRSCSRLYLQEDIADVYFIFNQNDTETRIPAHKVILAGGSPVFRSMFYGPLKELGNVRITDCSYESFKEFLQFFYLTNVTLSMEHVAEVMNLVNKYDADPDDSFAICEQFMLNNYSIQMACWALDLAILYNRIELRQKLLAKMMKKPIELFATDSFKHCAVDALKSILTWEQTNCDEKIIFRACIDWAGNSCIDKNLDRSDGKMIRQQLGDCLYLIQFAAMSKADISACISEWKGLFSKDELIDIINIATEDAVGIHTKLNYFVHTGRVKSIQRNDRGVTIASLNLLQQSDLKKREIGYFLTSASVSLVAIDTHMIQAKRNGICGTISGDLAIFEVKMSRCIHQQSISVPVVPLDGQSLFDHRIELSQPVTLEKGKTFHIVFSFDSWIDGQYGGCTTKKTDKLENSHLQFSCHS